MSTEESVASSQFPLGIERDIENARVLIEEPPWRDSPQKYRKSAEAILRRILTVDPENQSVKALLAKAEEPLPEIAPPPAPPPPPPARVVRAAPEELSFVVRAPVKTRPEKKPAKSSISGLLGFAAAFVAAGVLIFSFLSNRLQSQYVPKPVSASPEIAQVTVPVVDPPVVVVDEPEASPPSPPVVNSVSPAIIEVKATAPPVAMIQTGTLAVSSPTTVDIYMGDQFLGSAPTTLELPAGNQKLEYRHQEMRKSVTHVIKANETTTAMITFDVPVQINARPWAQVFIEGSQRQPLGQTPLSDVRVPIGSVLVFENPNFTGKNYRVTGRETEIRVNFP